MNKTPKQPQNDINEQHKKEQAQEHANKSQADKNKQPKSNSDQQRGKDGTVLKDLNKDSKKDAK